MVATVRLLRARPGFAAIVLLTLGLGIGAPTAVFSVIHAVLLRPLPYADADRLVQFRMEVRHPQGDAAFDALPASAALQWAGGSNALADLALYNDRALTLVTPAGPERLTGIAGTPNLFALLGVLPSVGTGFDAQTTDPRQIVLSDQVWRQHFGADPAILDSAVTLDGEAFIVRGVMPPDFDFPSRDAAFWVPLVITPGGSRGMLLPAVARLKPGAAVAEVVEEGRRVLREDGDSAGEQTLIVRTLHSQLVGPVARVVWVVFVAVALVSVVATANLALLLLVRGAGRAQEFGIRLAMGASTGQLVRQLLAEAAGLAVIGGTLGVAMAAALVGVLVRTAPPGVPRLQDIAVDVPVLAFAMVTTVLTTLVFAALSMGRTIAAGARQGFGAGSGQLVDTSSPRRRMQFLAASEVAVSMVLLVAAGVLLNAFLARALIDHGFNPRNGVAIRVSLPPGRYPGVAARQAFQLQLLERLQQAPGVDAVGLITSLPNRQASARFGFNPKAVPLFHDPLTVQVAEVRMATEGFFAAMGMPVEGREFERTDALGSESVVVISEQLARLHFPEGGAVGKMLFSGAAGSMQVVGVVPDVLPADGRPPSPAAYLPLRQHNDVLQWFTTVNVILRGDNAPGMMRAARAAVSAIDREVPVFGARTLDQEVAGLVAGPRFVASVLTAFAVAALFIASIGVYGVMAYSTSRRTREVGIRMALGATRTQVTTAILREGLLVIATGLFVGGVASTWLSQLLTGVVPEAPPVSVPVLTLVTLVLAGAALVAAYLPTRRATAITAVDALRHD
jgi:putative ABC transport system permease protein